MISCASLDHTLLRIRKVFPLVRHDVHWDGYLRAFCLTATIKLHTGKLVSYCCHVEDFSSAGQTYLDHVVRDVVGSLASYALEAE